MIAPQELRLDSLLYVPGLFGPSTLVEAVESINAKGEISTKSTQAHFSCYRPIELTEDWLEKFGFEAERSTVYLKLKYSMNVSDYVLYDRETKELLFVKDNQVWLCKQEYIHQLQNLFHSLTGEELTIKEQS